MGRGSKQTNANGKWICICMESEASPKDTKAQMELRIIIFITSWFWHTKNLEISRSVWVQLFILWWMKKTKKQCTMQRFLEGSGLETCIPAQSLTHCQSLVIFPSWKLSEAEVNALYIIKKVLRSIYSQIPGLLLLSFGPTNPKCIIVRSWVVGYKMNFDQNPSLLTNQPKTSPKSDSRYLTEIRES